MEASLTASSLLKCSVTDSSTAPPPTRIFPKDLERRLVEAAARDDLSTVRKLLKKKIDANVRDELGNTALAVASKAGHSAVVKILLESGADVGVRGGALVTPLHSAAYEQHAEAVKRLILGGADLHVKNLSGLRPIDVVPFNCLTWDVLHAADNLVMPVITEYSEVPIVPDYAIARGAAKTKTKKKKSGKKGKKGKKSGRKKGKKKKKK